MTKKWPKTGTRERARLFGMNHWTLRAHEHITQGKCSRCTNPAPPNRRTCEACHAKIHKGREDRKARFWAEMERRDQEPPDVEATATVRPERR